MDITKNVASLRMEFRAEKGIVNTNCIHFLDCLPEYCDWLEEKIIAAQINMGSTALHTTGDKSDPADICPQCKKYELIYNGSFKWCSKCGYSSV